MAYENNKIPNRKAFTGIAVTKPYSPRYVSNADSNVFFRTFMTNTCNDLRKGKRAICFYKYQIDALLDKYSDKLEYSYNSENEGYECRLKKGYKNENK